MAQSAQVPAPRTEQQPRSSETEIGLDAILTRSLGGSVLRYSIDIGGSDLKNVSKARRSASAFLGSITPWLVECVTEGAVDETVTCISEVVGDAVENGGVTHVRLYASHDAFAVVVGSGQSPNGSVPVIRTDVDPDSERGRGLQIVDRLSKQMGFVVYDNPTLDDSTSIDTWFVRGYEELAEAA